MKTNFRNYFLLTPVLFLCMTFHLGSNAQLNKQDSTALASIKTELLLKPSQAVMADSLFIAASAEIKTYDSQITKLVRSGLPKEETDLKVSVLNQKKKDVRDLRDLELTMLFTPDQKKIYDEKIKPVKPQVLHFGMNHDRASCDVCK